MTADQLSKMTVQQLRDLAAAHGILNRAKLKKGELVSKLTALAASGRQRPAETAAPNKPAAGPSSGQAARPTPAAAAKAPEPGLPIPSRYGRNRLVLMVQDPFHVFAYWELGGDALAQAQKAAGEPGTPVLLLHTAHGNEQREVDLSGGNYYLSVAPGGNYQAELALRDSRGRLHPLARSNRVATPVPAPSTRRDEAWMAVDETFHELLDEAGLPGAVGQAGNSASRLASKRITAWADTGVPSLSSGALSSRSLGSHSLVKP